MANRIAIVFLATFGICVLTAVGFGIRYQIKYGAADQARQQAEYLQKKEAKRKNDIFEICVTQIRWRVRDEVRRYEEIRLAANFWDGDERVVVVSGFARTVKGDIPVMAELSKCASGYRVAAYTIGDKTTIGDDVEYARTQEIMRKR